MGGKKKGTLKGKKGGEKKFPKKGVRGEKEKKSGFFVK